MSTTATTEVASRPSTGMKTNRKRLPGWFTPLAVIGALALGWGILELFFPEGATVISTVIVGMILYVIIVPTVSWLVEGSRYAKDRMVSGLIVSAFLIAVAPLISLLWMALSNGLEALDWNFLTKSNFGLTLADVSTGAGHAIVGTLLVTGMTALIAVPLGVLTAIYLVEYSNGSRLSRIVTFLVDIMTGIPSIVAGLFAAAMIPTLANNIGLRTGFMGAVALVVLMTPIVVRNTEEMLRIVPNELREASYALGVTKARTVIKVVLRTALPGIISGIVIAIARVIGETAPLLVTAGVTDPYNWNLFDGQMTTLPVYVYNMWGNTETRPLAWAGALVLILIVLLLNLIARIIAKAFAPKGEK